MILTGKQILEEIQQGKIEITNFNENNINPNSYDVTLADEIAFYADKELDMRKDNDYKIVKIGEDGSVLMPGSIYLARTNEKTITNHFAPMIEGRSSVGRLGIQVHSTAGFGDVGFNGYWTLEITVAQPVRIYPNIKIGQVYFHEVKGEIDLYKGKYQDNNELQGSMMFKDFSTGSDINVGRKEPSESDLALMNFYFKRHNCEWFTKDKNGYIYAFAEKPKKGDVDWDVCYGAVNKVVFNNLSHLSWDDTEPYEYKPKVELKVGDKFYAKETGKECEIITITNESGILQYFLKGDAVWYTERGISNFFYSTKAECEARYGEK